MKLIHRKTNQVHSPTGQLFYWFLLAVNHFFYKVMIDLVAAWTGSRDRGMVECRGWIEAAEEEWWRRARSRDRNIPRAHLIDVHTVLGHIRPHSGMPV